MLYSKNDTFMSVSPRKRAENQRNTTFEREIIPEEDEEKEKDQVDSNRVSKEEFKINPNFVCTLTFSSLCISSQVESTN